jgi:hypothetical protein
MSGTVYFTCRVKMLLAFTFVCLGSCQGFYSPSTPDDDDAVLRDGRPKVDGGRKDAVVVDADTRIPLSQTYSFNSDDSILVPFRQFNNRALFYGIDSNRFSVTISQGNTAGLLALDLNQFAIKDTDTIEIAIDTAIAESASMPACPLISILLPQNRRIDLQSNSQVCDGSTCSDTDLYISKDPMLESTVSIVLKNGSLTFSATKAITISNNIRDIANATIQIGADCERVMQMVPTTSRTHSFGRLVISNSQTMP